jgi:tetrapyrrole methylase family protein/MazG family protein
MAKIDELKEVIKRLRAKDGCPWDREQTHASLKGDIMEEAAELLCGINLYEETGNPESMMEELGDLLMLIVMESEIASEEGLFDFEDAAEHVKDKMVRRHPHVFGDVTADTTDQVLKNWDAIKMETKGQERYTDTLTSVAKSLPALMRAQKVGKRAMRAGMDFRCAEDAVACINDEKAELDAAVISGNKADIEEEMGDLLFSCVNAARHLGVDAELALKAATEKFIKRFSVTEELVSKEKLDMKNLPIEELDIYWDKAKSIISKMEEQKND